ncbi:MAG: rhodanese-like domain-containing protein [Coleofasciculaceae cyanobacterium SM2_3_26]|nr:rhodanese-like domain-containing protein [Coleofasciculaceae cyanobacterium SM2_3_26]
MTATYKPQLQEISPVELKFLLDRGDIDLVDVREPGEHASERIAGSVLVPLSQFRADALPTSGKRLVLYCNSSNRSEIAAHELFAAGYSKVAHLADGIQGWKEAGYPVVTSKRAPIAIMRQVQIVAGSLILTGTLLGAFVSPGFLFLSGFVGAGLLFAGVSNTCMMARLLARLPYNQRI